LDRGSLFLGLDFGRESRLTTDEDKCFEISGHIERMNVEEVEELRAVKERKKRERINKRFLSLFAKGEFLRELCADTSGVERAPSVVELTSKKAELEVNCEKREREKMRMSEKETLNNFNQHLRVNTV